MNGARGLFPIHGIFLKLFILFASYHLFFFFFGGWGVGGGVGGGGGGEGWIGQLYEYPSVLLVVLITYYFTDIMEITLSFQSQ